MNLGMRACIAGSAARSSWRGRGEAERSSRGGDDEDGPRGRRRSGLGGGELGDEDGEEAGDGSGLGDGSGATASSGSLAASCGGSASGERSEREKIGEENFLSACLYTPSL